MIVINLLTVKTAEDLYYIHHEQDNERHRKLIMEEENIESTTSRLNPIQNPYVTPEKPVSIKSEVIKKDVDCTDI